MSSHPEQVILPDSFGFCEGVEAADQLLYRVTDEAHAAGINEVYGLHEIVHNADVVGFHEARGVRFVDSIEEIPNNQLVVTSAHGVGPRVVSDLEQKGATTFDAACPLVIHTHRHAQLARAAAEKVLYVCHGKPGEGKKLHDEVLGMVGHLDEERLKDGTVRANPVERHYLELGEAPTPAMLAANGLYRIVTQTTLLATGALEYRQELKAYIEAQQPEARIKISKRGEVCFAVEDRQAGVGQLVELRPRRVVVVTDPGSSNGRSYVALAEQLTADNPEITVHAVANAQEARELPAIDGVTGLTASASTPDKTTLEVAKVLGLKTPPNITREAFKLRDLRGNTVREKVQAHTARLRAA